MHDNNLTRAVIACHVNTLFLQGW